jgi:hypothetical protein
MKAFTVAMKDAHIGNRHATGIESATAIAANTVRKDFREKEKASFIGRGTTDKGRT